MIPDITPGLDARKTIYISPSLVEPLSAASAAFPHLSYPDLVRAGLRRAAAAAGSPP